MTLRIQSPATGGLVKEIESDTPATIAVKVARARAAQPAWAARPLEERIETVRRFRQRMVDDKERLAAITTSETAPMADVRAAKIPGARAR